MFNQLCDDIQSTGSIFVLSINLYSVTVNLRNATHVGSDRLISLNQAPHPFSGGDFEMQCLLPVVASS